MYSKLWRRVDETEKTVCMSALNAAPVVLSNITAGLNIRVLSSSLPDGISGQVQKNPEGGYIVKVNRRESKLRQRFTVAHEIGHVVLHKAEIDEEGISDSILFRSRLSNKKEWEANSIAADILMPPPLVSSALEAAGYGLGDAVPLVLIAKLADLFKVSELAMEVRLK